MTGPPTGRRPPSRPLASAAGAASLCGCLNSTKRTAIKATATATPTTNASPLRPLMHSQQWQRILPGGASGRNLTCMGKKTRRGRSRFLPGGRRHPFITGRCQGRCNDGGHLHQANSRRCTAGILPDSSRGDPPEFLPRKSSHLPRKTCPNPVLLPTLYGRDDGRLRPRPKGCPRKAPERKADGAGRDAGARAYRSGCGERGTSQIPRTFLARRASDFPRTESAPPRTETLSRFGPAPHPCNRRDHGRPRALASEICREHLRSQPRAD
jgi:hypothetical protein